MGLAVILIGAGIGQGRAANVADLVAPQVELLALGDAISRWASASVKTLTFPMVRFVALHAAHGIVIRNRLDSRTELLETRARMSFFCQDSFAVARKCYTKHLRKRSDQRLLAYDDRGEAVAGKCGR